MAAPLVEFHLMPAASGAPMAEICYAAMQKPASHFALDEYVDQTRGVGDRRLSQLLLLTTLSPEYISPRTLHSDWCLICVKTSLWRNTWVTSLSIETTNREKIHPT